MGDFMGVKQNDTSDYHLMFDDGSSFVGNYFNNTTAFVKNDSQFFDVNDNQLKIDNKFNSTFRPSLSPRRMAFMQTLQLDTISEEEETEPSLLEELEIYPEQIFEKAMMMMNPFINNSLGDEQFLTDIDLSGPMFFCFLFAACLFLAGKMLIFSHVYGLSVISVLGMYGLLRLMSHDQHEHLITIKGVASALGYGMLHLIWFSFIGIFIRLNTFDGFVFAIPAVILSTVGASRILGVMLNQPNNTALIAYPTAIIYIMFSFLVTF